MNSKLKHNQPKIDFQDVRRAWFDYAGQSHSVASAPTSVFKAAVLEKAPAWKYHAEYKSFFRKRELDLLDRWYLLCDLIRIDRPITLHARVEQVAG
jgi:hypothetical protein